MKSSSFTIDFEKLAADLWKLIEDPTFNPYKGYKDVAGGFLCNIVHNQRRSMKDGNPMWDSPEELANAMMNNEDDHKHYQEIVHWIKERAVRKAMGNEGI